MYGSDARHSMEPDEFKNFVRETNDAFTIYQSFVDKNNISYLKSNEENFSKKYLYKKKYY